MTMQYHLDHGFKLKTETEHKNLYKWAICETDENGKITGRDQIPWEWSFHFSAISCEAINEFSIDKPFSLFEDQKDGSSTAQTKQTIRVKLKPTGWKHGELTEGAVFSMFGTSRAIKDFTLEIKPLSSADEDEVCRAWGSASYTAEVDFRDETTEDCVWFYLDVKPETFAQYIAQINAGNVNDISFRVSGVEGFYSDWSPGISTDNVKVLLRGEEHYLDQPKDAGFDVPRLGKVGEARLSLHRTLNMKEDTASPIQPLRIADTEAVRSDNKTQGSVVDLGVSTPLLKSIKRAAWAIVTLLVLIFLNLLSK